MAAGDFNLTERSALYAFLRGFLRNAHEEAGWTPAQLFRRRAAAGWLLPPMIRIDHVFYSSDLTPPMRKF